MLPALLLPFVIAALDWIALFRNWTALDAVAKPGVILALLSLIWISYPGSLHSPTLIWFQIGLVLSLIGDVLLMLPRERFLGGLVAFLLAHLAYIRGFTFQGFILTPLFIGLCVLVILASGLIFRPLITSINQSGYRKLMVPTSLYALVISLTVIASLSTWFRPAWSGAGALLVSIGAGLFYLSDTLLAWNRFIKRIPNGQLIIRICYHLGQYAIVTGVIHASLHFPQ